MMLLKSLSKLMDMHHLYHRSTIRTHNRGSVIHVFGISAMGSLRRFCQAVAHDSGGNYFDVP